jgi:hypothetical protein
MIAGNVNGPELLPELVPDRQGQELREPRSRMVDGSPVKEPPEKSLKLR